MIDTLIDAGLLAAILNLGEFRALGLLGVASGARWPPSRKASFYTAVPFALIIRYLDSTQDYFSMIGNPHLRAKEAIDA